MKSVGGSALKAIALTITLIAVAVSSASAASWSSFQAAEFQGITVDKAFVSSATPVTYTLALAVDPKIKLDGIWYNVTEVWGFYCVSDTAGNGTPYLFDESRALKTGWILDPKKEGDDFAGWWNSSKDLSIKPGKNDSYTFNSLDLRGHSGILGLHVSLSQPYNGTYTLGVKQTDHFENAPEPSSLAALGLVLSTLGASAIRRRK